MAAEADAPVRSDYVHRSIPLIELLGINRESAESGRSRLSLDLSPELRNMCDAFHGGVIMTLLEFRRLLEAQGLTKQLFETINAHLAEKGLMMREGTIVDATIIVAPPSTKNRGNARDPEMHQAKKGNQWHFGMKTQISADIDPGLVHTVVGMAANVADVTQAHALLHGKETEMLALAGYQGVHKLDENKALDIQ